MPNSPGWPADSTPSTGAGSSYPRKPGTGRRLHLGCSTGARPPITSHEVKSMSTCQADRSATTTDCHRHVLRLVGAAADLYLVLRPTAGETDWARAQSLFAELRDARSRVVENWDGLRV